MFSRECNAYSFHCGCEFGASVYHIRCPEHVFFRDPADGDGGRLWCFVLLDGGGLRDGQRIAVPGRQNPEALAKERYFVIASQKNNLATYRALQAALHHERAFIGSTGLWVGAFITNVDKMSMPDVLFTPSLSCRSS